jgi:hypothetical protein
MPLSRVNFRRNGQLQRMPFFFLHKIFVLCAFDAIRRISNSNGALWPLHKRQKGEKETTGDMMRPRISVSSGEITRLPRQKENKSSKSTKSAEEYRTGTAAEIYVNNQRNRPSDR